MHVKPGAKALQLMTHQLGRSSCWCCITVHFHKLCVYRIQCVYCTHCTGNAQVLYVMCKHTNMNVNICIGCRGAVFDNSIDRGHFCGLKMSLWYILKYCKDIIDPKQCSLLYTVSKTQRTLFWIDDVILLCISVLYLPLSIPHIYIKRYGTQAALRECAAGVATVCEVLLDQLKSEAKLAAQQALSADGPTQLTPQASSPGSRHDTHWQE